MNEDQIRELLHEMRDDPVPPDSLARVRAAVAQRQRRRVPWFRAWRVAATLMAAASAAAVFLVLRSGSAVQAPAPPAVAVQAAPEVPKVDPAPVSKPVRVVERPVRHLVKRAMRRPRAEPPLPIAPAAVTPPLVAPTRAEDDVLIRIETPDPDVVILLVGD
jgi:hypothetical protein